MGETAKKMANVFSKVYTIEKSEVIFQKASKILSNFPNVNLICGDSREVLKEILEKEDDILFWLDAHCSGGETYGKNDECPLIDELNIIFQKNKNYCLLIDDARLFLCPPPVPHDYKKWPTIKEILNVIPDDKQVIIFEDVIFIYPEEIDEIFRKSIQKKTTKEWQQSNITFLKAMKIAIKALFKGKLI
ncbi:hypothetical protein [Caldisericum exile]|uniref:hypothetical protein n=1 Tax=Caldisericum exile TaxID=693075 RepID=UPI003C793441